MGEELRKPFGSYVLIKNPMTREMYAKEEAALEKLPEESRKNYMEEHYGDMWDGVEILAVGEDCRFLRPGDKAITSGPAASTATYSKGDEFMFIREGQFVGKL